MPCVLNGDGPLPRTVEAKIIGVQGIGVVAIDRCAPIARSRVGKTCPDILAGACRNHIPSTPNDALSVGSIQVDHHVCWIRKASPFEIEVERDRIQVAGKLDRLRGRLRKRELMVHLEHVAAILAQALLAPKGSSTHQQDKCKSFHRFRELQK